MIYAVLFASVSLFVLAGVAGGRKANGKPTVAAHVAVAIIALFVTATVYVVLWYGVISPVTKDEVLRMMREDEAKRIKEGR